MRPYGAADGQSTRLYFRNSHVLSSKRFRIALLCVFLVSFLLWSTAYFGETFFTPGLISSRTILSANSSYVDDDWSRFAYIQYATNTVYLCNSLMLFESLHRLGNQVDRLLMYPAVFQVQEGKEESIASKLLRRARDRYRVKLVPIEVQHIDGGDGKPCQRPWGKHRTDGLLGTWAESFTKLLAFNQTQYERVIHLDSDSTLLQVRLSGFFILSSSHCLKKT